MTEYITIKLPASFIEPLEIITEWCGWSSRAEMVKFALLKWHDDALAVLKAEVKKNLNDPNLDCHDRLRRAHPALYEKFMAIMSKVSSEIQSNANT